MTLNTKQSVDTGRRLLKTYGSWEKVREASQPGKHGVLLVKPRDLGRLHEKAAALKAK
ncbi:hypothetical protein [Brevundimonas sp.]|uniref:hypothetical protein n=1 Tax=Brevundimonas sp. TaxID=1871086 RepID=UPI00286B15B3|nr:hypothetical protein [Brevundimonas sp.]